MLMLYVYCGRLSEKKTIPEISGKIELKTPPKGGRGELGIRNNYIINQTSITCQ